MNQNQVAAFLPIIRKPALCSAAITCRAVKEGSLAIYQAGTDMGTVTRPWKDLTSTGIRSPWAAKLSK